MTQSKRTPSQIYSVAERIQVWEDAGRMCHYCDTALPKPGTKAGKKTHLDHKRAQSTGGKDDLSNLLVCCKICNRKKGNKSYERFLVEELEAATKKAKRLKFLHTALIVSRKIRRSSKR